MATMRLASTRSRRDSAFRRGFDRVIERGANLPGYAAATWSAGYAGLPLWSATGWSPAWFDRLPGAGLPGAGLPGAPLLVALGALGAAVALTTNRRKGTGVPRLAVLAFAWSVSAVLLAVANHGAVRGLAFGLLFGVEPIGWLSVRDAFCVAGGLSWALVALTYQAATQPTGVGRLTRR